MIDADTAITILVNTTYADEFQGMSIVQDAQNAAIEALKKQAPKIPNLTGDGYSDGEIVYDTWICPNCEQEYEIEYDHYNFCPSCGQAIDWTHESEVQDEQTD